MSRKVTRTERGWGGHFICAHSCLFRRNTLLESDTDKVVISTVGAMRTESGSIETIGAFGRFYETMVFGADQDGEYIEANVEDQRDFNAEWAICADSVDELPEYVDNKADNMHEAVVKEFYNAMKRAKA